MCYVVHWQQASQIFLFRLILPPPPPPPPPPPSAHLHTHTHTHTHPRSTNQLPRDRVGIIRTPCKYNPKRNKKKPTNKNGCAIFFCNNKSKTNILDADSNTMSDHRVFFGFFCFSFPFFFKSLSTFYLSMMARLAIHHL